MRRTSGLSSGEFLKQYTIPLLVDNGLPLAALKMMDNKNKTCPFVTPDGCEIYQDRPWSCRMFPIFTSPLGEKSFFIEERNSCLGYKEEKWWTIEGWKKDQGIDIYDKMNEFYEEITLNEFFLKGNKLDPEKSRMLYMACYDLDEFKKFLFETRYFDAYDVERGIIEKLEKDQEQLLGFGYKWVISNLFKEKQ
jgi:Fe-S-cluster containining protein